MRYRHTRWWMPNVTSGSNATVHGLRILTHRSLFLSRASRAIRRAHAIPAPGRAQAAGARAGGRRRAAGCG